MKWIDINEYASKYSVSLHSIRNKILLSEVDFICDSGRYKIEDKPLNSPYSFIDKIQKKKPFINYEETIFNLQKKLREKEEECHSLKTQYADIKNLLDWVEQENREMKKIVKGMKRVDDFMKNPRY